MPWVAGWATCSAGVDVATAQASAVQDLIDVFGRLPGIGPKSAQRIAYHLLKADAEESRRLAAAVVAAKERVGFCSRCFNLSETEICALCTDERRDTHVLCVVEEPRDVIAERLELARAISQKVFVYEAVAHDHVRHREQQRNVTPDANR